MGASSELLHHKEEPIPLFEEELKRVNGAKSIFKT